MGNGQYLPRQWGKCCPNSSFRIDDPTTKEKIPTTKMMTKKIYYILIQQADDDFTKRHKWEYDFSYPIDWKPIWKAAYENFSKNKHCDLHWRVLQGFTASPSAI